LGKQDQRVRQMTLTINALEARTPCFGFPLRFKAKPSDKPPFYCLDNGSMPTSYNPPSWDPVQIFLHARRATLRTQKHPKTDPFTPSEPKTNSPAQHGGGEQNSSQRTIKKIIFQLLCPRRTSLSMPV